MLHLLPIPVHKAVLTVHPDVMNGFYLILVGEIGIGRIGIMLQTQQNLQSVAIDLLQPLNFLPVSQFIFHTHRGNVIIGVAVTGETQRNKSPIQGSQNHGFGRILTITEIGMGMDTGTEHGITAFLLMMVNLNKFAAVFLVLSQKLQGLFSFRLREVQDFAGILV